MCTLLDVNLGAVTTALVYESEDRPRLERPQARPTQEAEDLNVPTPHSSDSIRCALLTPSACDKDCEKGPALIPVSQAPLEVIGEATILDDDNDGKDKGKGKKRVTVKINVTDKDDDENDDEASRVDYAKWTISFACAFCAMVYFTSPPILTMLTNVGASLFKKNG